MDLVKRMAICLAFMLFVATISAQSPKIDSLKTVLKNHTEQDSITVENLLLLTEEYRAFDLDKLKETALEAKQLSEKIGYKKGVVGGLQWLGIYYNICGKQDLALRHFDSLKTVSERINYQIGIANGMGLMAMVYAMQGKTKESLILKYKALQIYEKENYRQGQALIYNDLGITYQMIFEYSEAKKYFLKMIPVAEELDNTLLKTFAYSNLGDIYIALEKHDSAKIWIDKALDLVNNAHENPITAYSYTNLGRIYMKKELYDSAYIYLSEALAISERSNDINSLPAALFHSGEYYNKTKQIKLAEAHYWKCYTVSTKHGALPYAIQAASALHAIYKLKNEKNKALNFLEIYVELNDSLQSDANKKKTFLTQVTYNFERQKEKIEREHEKQETLSQKEIEKQKLVRNSFAMGLFLVLIIGVFILKNYRDKQKHNLILTAQKEEIECKNEALNQQNEEIAAQRDEIEESHKILTNQKERIENIHKSLSDSIRYAQKIQAAILPSVELLSQKTADHFVFFKPRDVVSGDFYWWTAANELTIITAADCTGHGVPGAFMSMLGISLLRKIIDNQTFNTANILYRLREEIINILQSNARDGMDMALISINHKKGTLQFSGANNPVYLIRKGKLNTNTKGEIKTLNKKSPSAYILHEILADKMPISSYVRMDKFSSVEFSLQKGDQIYLFSDGYTDQFGGSNSRKFMRNRFKHLLLNNAHKPMSKQKEILNNTMNKWMGKTRQIDDILVLGVKI